MTRVTAAPVRPADLSKDFLALGMGVLVLTMLHLPALSGRSAYWMDDTVRLWTPYNALVGEALREGSALPWLLGHECGFPAWADCQMACFYPPNLLRALPLSPTLLYAWQVFSHYLLCLVGMYLLARALGAGRIGSVTGAVVFCAAGFMAAHLIHITMLAGAAYMPWCWWAALCWRRDAAWYGPPVIALATGLGLLAGYPQIIMIAALGAALMVALDVLCDASEGSWRRRCAGAARQVAVVGLAVALGMGIAAIQVLPTLHLTEISPRGERSHEFSTTFSLEPAKLPFLLTWACAVFPFDAWEWVGFMGLGTFCAALIAVVSGPRSRMVRVLCWLCLIALFMGFSAINPLYNIIWRLPLVGAFRGPCRWLFVFCTALAMLCAVGIGRLRAGEPLPPKARLLGWLALALGLFLAVGAGLVAVAGARIPIPAALTAVLSSFDVVGLNAGTVQRAIVASAPHMLLAAIAVGVLGWACIRPASKGGARLRAGAVAACIIAEALLFGWRANPVVPREALDAPLPELALLQSEGRVMRGTPGFDRVRSRAIVPQQREAALRHWRSSVLPNVGAVDGIAVVEGYAPMRLRNFDELLKAVAPFRLEPEAAALFGTRWLVADRPSCNPPPGWALRQTNAGVRVYENLRWQGLAWLATGVSPLEGFAGAISSPGGRRSLGDVVFTDDAPPAPPTGPAGVARMVEARGRSLIFEAQVECPANLVIASNWYPGVRARVDGEPAPVMRCNIAFCGVSVTRGRHQVELEYATPWVGVGAGISIAAVVMLLAMTWTLRRRSDPEADR